MLLDPVRRGAIRLVLRDETVACILEHDHVLRAVKGHERWRCWRPFIACLHFFKVPSEIVSTNAMHSIRSTHAPLAAAADP